MVPAINVRVVRIKSYVLIRRLPRVLWVRGVHASHTAASRQGNFPYVGNLERQNASMAASLQRQLGKFLREKRGEASLPAFARKVGISSSSLHRMEMGEQNVTLKTLEHLLRRFNCRLADIFPNS